MKTRVPKSLQPRIPILWNFVYYLSDGSVQPRPDSRNTEDLYDI